MSETLRSPESDAAGLIEWQINSGSNTAHAIDISRPGWRTQTGKRRRNGPRSLCGKYPQRNADGVWFSLAVADPGALPAIQRYHSRVCDECLTRVTSE